MRKLFAVTISWYFLASIAYAGKYDDISVYFPMTPGTVWTYQQGKDQPPEWQVRVTDCGTSYADFVPGLRGELSGCSIKSSFGSVFPPRYDIFTIQGDAVLNRATKVANVFTGEMKEWKLNIPSEIVLRSPLKSGTKWETVLDADSKMRFKVISIGKESVKAGEYNNVVKIKREQFSKDKKTKKWKHDMDPACNFYIYYAPGVGLIKEEMIYKNKVEVFRELVEFNPPNEKSGN